MQTARAAVDMPIIFESDKLGAFKTTIQYSLNKCFASSLAMSVNVVRPYLKLLDTQVSMRFDSRYLGKPSNIHINQQDRTRIILYLLAAISKLCIIRHYTI